MFIFKNADQITLLDNYDIITSGNNTIVRLYLLTMFDYLIRSSLIISIYLGQDALDDLK
jgi:hypothetical protein